MNRIVFWLSIILIFGIPWEDMVSIPIIGSLARLAGIVLFGVWALAIIMTGRVRKPHLFHIVLSIFVLWNISSLFWTFGFELTKSRVITYTQIFFLTIIIWDIYRTPSALNAGLQAYITGAWVAVLSTLFNYYSGVLISTYEVGRYSASGINAGDFVIILAIGIPIAWYLARSAERISTNHILKVINYAYIPFSGLAMLLTGSRLAIFALIPALIYILGTLIRPNRILTNVVLLLAICGVLLVLQSFVPQSTWERLSTARTSILEGDLGGRVSLWKEGINAFLEHPITGVGAGAFRIVNPYGSAAHNTYLSVLAELGFFGLVLFLSLLAIVCYSLRYQTGSELKLWVTVLAILVIGISVQTWEFTKTTFFVFSMVVISASLSKYRTPVEIKPQASDALAA
jgi:O-antigen ligase